MKSLIITCLYTFFCVFSLDSYSKDMEITIFDNLPNWHLVMMGVGGYFFETNETHNNVFLYIEPDFL